MGDSIKVSCGFAGSAGFAIGSVSASTWLAGSAGGSVSASAGLFKIVRWSRSVTGTGCCVLRSNRIKSSRDKSENFSVSTVEDVSTSEVSVRVAGSAAGAGSRCVAFARALICFLVMANDRD